ncbi:MAG: acyl-CoA dehydrogenase family protein [Deltaproteobacteria bacterium]|nr:acyl-CoA dehydrogenase family protein [Deltaproteobacteria bacterium]
MPYFDLDQTLSEQDLALKASAAAFAQGVMRPVSRQLDRMTPEEAIASQSPFWGFLREAYRLGYHKLPFPEALGGPGLTPLQIQIVMEELAWGSFGLTLALNTSLDAAVAMGGTREHVEQFTIPYCQCTDASYIGCWAITEPDHGSDTVMPGYPTFRDPAIKANCHARLDGDEWVITGQKSAWVSGGTIANRILLMCQIHPAQSGHAGSGMFLFTLDRPGVAKGKPLDKIGARDLNQGEIFFDAVRIPREALVVGPEAYEAALEAHLCLTLPMVGTWATGLARAAFDEALAYAREREQGGRPIADHPTVQVKLFDMFRKVEASRQLCRAVFVHNWGSPAERRAIEYAEAAKTFATQTALEVTSDAIQIFGGIGLARECVAEKLFRDARSSLICDGSNDILALSGGHRIARAHPRCYPAR